MDWAEVKNAVDRVTAHSEGRYTYEHDIRGWLPVVMEGGKIKAPPTLVTDMQLLANAYLAKHASPSKDLKDRRKELDRRIAKRKGR